MGTLSNGIDDHSFNQFVYMLCVWVVKTPPSKLIIRFHWNLFTKYYLSSICYFWMILFHCFVTPVHLTINYSSTLGASSACDLWSCFQLWVQLNTPNFELDEKKRVEKQNSALFSREKKISNQEIATKFSPTNNELGV